MFSMRGMLEVFSLGCNGGAFSRDKGRCHQLGKKVRAIVSFPWQTLGSSKGLDSLPRRGSEWKFLLVSHGYIMADDVTFTTRDNDGCRVSDGQVATAITSETDCRWFDPSPRFDHLEGASPPRQ